MEMVSYPGGARATVSHWHRLRADKSGRAGSNFIADDALRGHVRDAGNLLSCPVKSVPVFSRLVRRYVEFLKVA